MEKIIKIPKGTKYLSQFPQILNDLTDKCILDKVITGIGATTMFLDNSICNEDIILCSPRKSLIISKLNDSRLKDHIICFDNYIDKLSLEDKKKKLKTFLLNKIDNSPIKILTTYDSFFAVKEVIQSMYSLDCFRVVVDECQCIIGDGAFKPETELLFINSLKDINKIVYLSATPPSKEIREKIEIFKDIDLIRLDYNKEDLRIINKISQILKPKKSFVSIVKSELETYNNKGYFRKKIINGKEYFSKELVIFISNVKEIAHIIKETNLTKEQVNVLCSENSETKLYDYTRKRGIKGSGFKCGSIPKKGEKHKLITFATKFSFEGCDMYSDNATTFIFANSSINTMLVDISTDFRQIVGRQRLKENVFRNDIEVYYKLGDTQSISAKELRNNKLAFTNSQIDLFNNLSEGQKEWFIKTFKGNNFLNNYVFINPTTNKAEVCTIALIAEEFAEEKRNNLVKEDIKVLDVCSSVYENDIANNKKDQDITSLTKLYFDFKKADYFQGKLKEVCMFLDENKELKELISQNIIDNKYITLWEKLGTEVCKANLFREDYLTDKLKEYNLQDEIKIRLKERINIGERNTLKYYKELVKEIFEELGIKTTAKASIIKKYFSVKNIFNRQTNENELLILC